MPTRMALWQLADDGAAFPGGRGAVIGKSAHVRAECEPTQLISPPQRNLGLNAGQCRPCAQKVVVRCW
jgi:hypothetical protein